MSENLKIGIIVDELTMVSNQSGLVLYSLLEPG